MIRRLPCVDARPNSVHVESGSDGSGSEQNRGYQCTDDETVVGDEARVAAGCDRAERWVSLETEYVDTKENVQMEKEPEEADDCYGEVG